MHEDRFGLPLSTANADARDAYVAGVDSMLSGVAGYRDSLARALALDPSFALAHVALARCLLLDAEADLARASARRARDLAGHATPREQSHIDMLCLGIEGKTALAHEAMLKHLRSWPRDAMVLAPATGVFGLYGFSGDPEHEEQLYELLTALAPAYGEDWWFDAAYGFAACETGRLDQASRLIERSLARHPRNANGAHIRSHVMYESGEAAAMLAYLEAWLPALPTRSLMHCHLSWHLTLSALATDNASRAWAAYNAAVHPGSAWGPPLNVGSDAPSFLWRAELAGQPRSEPHWQAIHAHALRHFPDAGMAFADVHALLAGTVVGDTAALNKRTDEIRQRIAEGRYPAGEVVLWIAEGFAAYLAGRWPQAIDALERALPQAVRIGGSRAQRDLVDLTLLAAYIHEGRTDAAARLAERRAHLPQLLDLPPSPLHRGHH